VRTTVLSFLLLFAACDSSNTTSADDQCASGERWTGGNRESPFMHPGRDCVSCHTQAGEGPRYAIAGTVFDLPHEADDCFGVADVIVQITGADGAVVELTSNDAGNFFLGKGAVATPYTAKLIYEGRERPMTTPQTDFNCASCHTATGTNAAPGRVLAP